MQPTQSSTDLPMLHQSFSSFHEEDPGLVVLIPKMSASFGWVHTHFGTNL